MIPNNKTASSRHRRTIVITLACIAAALMLAACGSSSSSTTASGTTASSTTAGSAQRRAAITACLQKAGITLPIRPAGSSNPTPGTSTTPHTGGLFGGGGSGSFSNPATRAALAKCGLSIGRRPAGTSRVNSPAFKTAVNNYVACMTKNGYSLPKPNLSGKGPVFTTSQVNRNDPKFKTASGKCQQLLNTGQSTPGSA